MDKLPTTESQLEGMRKTREQLLESAQKAIFFAAHDVESAEQVLQMAIAAKEKALTRAKEIAQAKQDRDRELYMAVKFKYDVAALIRGKDVKLEFDLVPIEKPPAGTTGNFLVVKNRGRDIESVEVIKDEAPAATPRTLSPSAENTPEENHIHTSKKKAKHETQETEAPSKIAKRKEGEDNERKRKRLG
ncbi:hypothetical protein W97_05068 [Coniosporium apollinis CBS 100218]|uniref:Uncharacterized protein n=1 Tax=Coniosporium apollinis (strain CBS 100218) TaxID=1168221 RepID=R7YVX8_CONA1|nr:uncharacterized protein W97_05068 [Coniosporium apollinis CBS 100218]EON65826.1 hypothetical protein W97_05068 [Coniosporium apollinis CBS 100218]